MGTAKALLEFEIFKSVLKLLMLQIMFDLIINHFSNFHIIFESNPRDSTHSMRVSHSIWLCGEKKSGAIWIWLNSLEIVIKTSKCYFDGRIVKQFKSHQQHLNTHNISTTVCRPRMNNFHVYYLHIDWKLFFKHSTNQNSISIPWILHKISSSFVWIFFCIFFTL